MYPQDVMAEDNVQGAVAYLKVSLFLAATGFLVLYVFPSLIEYALEPYFGPVLTTFALGDVIGLLAFWVLGFGRRGLLFYLAGFALKIALLWFGSAPQTLVWYADIIPCFAWVVASFAFTADLSQAIMACLERSLEY